MKTVLEHVNITVPNCQVAAATLCDLFDWRIRWQGDAINGGTSIHVGGDFSYVALYEPNKGLSTVSSSYELSNGLNHIAVVVDDLQEALRRVRDAGFETHSHADYEPGERFYFRDLNHLEIEVVSYSNR
ncbi:MAG: VOC family protein [Gammaproteobacteria bacterium]|nr:VOC family protein [Gammaproteobacteria bacterium]